MRLQTAAVKGCPAQASSERATRSQNFSDLVALENDIVMKLVTGPHRPCANACMGVGFSAQTLQHMA